MGEVTSRLRKSISKWANADDQHARDLRATYATVDCTPIDEAPDRERVKLRGTLRTVTLRPRGGVPALEAELFDGSGVIAAGLAGPAPDHRDRAGSLDRGRGPDRRARRAPGPLQPPLRAEDRVVTQAPPTLDTVEAVVRKQLSTALGGRRGMLEAAIPTIMFTVAFLTTKDLRTALVVSVAVAVVALLVRLVQRSTVQFVVNAPGRHRHRLRSSRCAAARAGGDADDQALAYFLPGLLYNAGYAVVLGALQP